MKTISLYFFLFLLSANILIGQNAQIQGKIVDTENGNAIPNANILLEETTQSRLSTKDGTFIFDNLKANTYHLLLFAEGYTTTTKKVKIEDNQQLNLTIQLDSLSLNLVAVEVEAEKRETYGIRRLRNVEGMAIYAAKKTEVIDMENLLANLATNNPRQVYKNIPGLNIWENDGAGLQLSIGARGLDPNRTSNFNTRQNGYDISADALGYPESYYTPPTQALRRIEIVRGAASLQYGPQFGGLLNFVLKKGNPNKAFEFVSDNSIGSFGLINTFNSIGGKKNDLNYYAFYQRKQGEGWRPNSQFHQNAAYINLEKKWGAKFKIGLNYTFMNYLAQQPGGLQDFEFNQDARQSKRSRNWFKVDWTLAALTLDYRISDKSKINNRSFLLDAQRQSLGELGPINRPDPLRERDLINGQYLNFGNETRFIHRYQIAGQLSTFLVGARYYQGLTKNDQGDASDGFEADFEFLNPTDLERSSYEFPSKNIALFAENLFNINSRWTITPGLRFEHIRTASDGYFKERIFSGGQVIFEQKFEDAKSNNRSLLLFGLGSSYKLKEGIECYANFSQNYRSINFSDLAVVNPNLIVDSLLTDERGYNFDLGIRGNLLDEAIRFDISAFHLKYQNRIGVGEIIISDPIVVEKAIAYRTNIGDARILGIEAYAEADFWNIFAKDNKDLNLSIFINASLLHGRYLSGQSNFNGNEVELIPPFSIKTGLNFRWKKLRASYQFAHVAEHFTDATNAIFVVDATRGLIPAYQVQDISVGFSFWKLQFNAGINNIMNANYFTRRASAYPGPGVIPSDGRGYYFGVRLKI